jgi:capsular exopolysaccharide synthesis family protein
MAFESPPQDPAEYRRSEAEVHLRDYWFLILKRRWLIVAVLATVLAITTVATLLQTPQYRATTLVQVDRGKINLVQDVMVDDRLAGYAEFYATQQRVLRSRTLAYRVMDENDFWRHPALQPRKGPWGKEPSVDREKLIDKLLSALEVSPLRSTQLIEVGFVSPDPELSARLVSAIVDEYIAFNSEAESGVAKNTESFIREQVEKLQSEIQQKEKLLQEYSQRQDIVMVDQKENIVIQQLEDLNRQLSQAQGKRAAAEARYRSLRSADAASIAEVRNSIAVQDLKRQYAALQKEYAELAIKFKPDWPEMKRARGAMEEVERRLDEEVRDSANKAIAAARVEYRTAARQEALLREALENQKKEAQGLNQLASDYNSIKVELDNQRTMLRQLLRRQSETGLSADLGERQPVNVRVVEEAVVPTVPFKPRLGKNLVLGCLLGFVLAIGLAFFLDYWDATIYTVEDLRRYVTLPYLGMVPRYEKASHGPKRIPSRAPSSRAVRGRLGSSSSRGTATRDNYLPALPGTGTVAARQQSPIGEQFRFLRGSLLLSSPGGPPRVVLVTSPEKGAGKTFVSCNLATSLADLGKKVLLVDADLRDPRLHRVFRMNNRVGLSSVLTGQRDVDRGCVFRTDVANVFVLLSGPLSPSPAELLESGAMDEVLARCTDHFDFVLMDSAPLLPVIDTHLLTTRCDAALLVVRSGQTSRYAVKTSVDLVERVRGKLTNVILNDVNLRDYSQQYYYSYHTYEYASSEEGAQKPAEAQVESWN